VDQLRATRITSALRRGSSRPVVVETPGGVHIVKLAGAAQGAGALVAEIVVAELAQAIGLQVPARALVEVPRHIEVADWDDELEDLLAASAGANLGFAWLDGATDFAAADVVRVPPAFRAAVLWLDRLVMNPDRTARNPNLLWHAGEPWLIDHGAALGFQYDWPRVTEDAPRAPWLPREAHLFEAVVDADALQAADAALAPMLTREVLHAAASLVPAEFLRARHPDADPVRRRAAFVAYLWKRLREPRPFLEVRELPAPPVRARPSWL
jgi:hypothetical protein